MKTIIKTLLLLFSGSSLFGQGVSYNQEFQVNTYTNAGQRYPVNSPLTNGGHVICWYSYSQDGSDYGVFGQIFNEDGSKRGGEFQMNTHTDNYQGQPSVTNLAGSGFVVCWTSRSQDGDGLGIFGQIFNEDGSKNGDEFQINTYTVGSQFQSDVSQLTNGGFIVCWVSPNQIGGKGIFGQVFNEEGLRRGVEFQINTNETYSPCVKNAPDGFIVCWDNYQTEGIDIFCQVFDESGTKKGDEFMVNSYTLNHQSNPSISVLVDGGFVVCWESVGQDGDLDGVYCQIYNGDGTKRGNELQVNTYTNRRQELASVTHLIDGGFIICWASDEQDGNIAGISSQIFNEDGSKRGPEFQVNDYPHNWQTFPNIGTLSSGGIIVCWNSWNQDGSNFGVYGKYYLNKLVHPLNIFYLKKPTTDKTLHITETTFEWTPTSILHTNFPWELEYKLYLGEDESFNNPRIISQIYDTTYTIDSLKPGTTYFWKVLAKNIENDSLWSSETNAFFVSHDAVTSVDEIANEHPQSFQLFANYPNPFNPETTIKYSLPAGQSIYNVKVKIYNALGQLIEVLVDNNQKPGLYTIKWTASNVPSGVYFCRIEAGQYNATQKMLLVR